MASSNKNHLSPASYHGDQPLRSVHQYSPDPTPASNTAYPEFREPAQPVYGNVSTTQGASSNIYSSPQATLAPRGQPASHHRNRSSSEAGRYPAVVKPDSSGQRQTIISGQYGSPQPSHYPYYPDSGAERYIIPASSHPKYQRRDRSLDVASKYRIEHIRYPAPGSTSSTKGYQIPPSSSKPPVIKVGDSFSYTNAREQFDRDSAAIARSRRDGLNRKPRPLSMTGLEAVLPSIEAGSRRSRIAATSTGPVRVKNGDQGKSSDNDDLQQSEARQRTPGRRAPVSLHQDKKPDHYPQEYTSSEGKGYRIRHDPDEDTVIVDDKSYDSTKKYPREPSRYPIRRDRVYSDNITSHGVASSGLATAGLASGYSRDSQEKAERRTDSTYGYDSDTYGYRSSSNREPSEAEIWVQKSRYAREPVTEDSGAGRPVHPSFTQQPRTRERSQSQSQSQSKESPPTPKSILKQPTQKFPEDKNTVREGVAPLKEIPGVPTGARWTKISRKLVSPSALDGRERFEERPDYVIVLRALTYEEISNYTAITYEIRCMKQTPLPLIFARSVDNLTQTKQLVTGTVSQRDIENNFCYRGNNPGGKRNDDERINPSRCSVSTVGEPPATR
ncbi:hypothetical protein FQN57_007174 [Myotisia sp. PD_48]|nr:hypothetical protein FQN57_007174 [Myotisia sp. PD_48]